VTLTSADRVRTPEEILREDIMEYYDDPEGFVDYS